MEQIQKFLVSSGIFQEIDFSDFKTFIDVSVSNEKLIGLKFLFDNYESDREIILGKKSQIEKIILKERRKRKM